MQQWQTIGIDPGLSGGIAAVFDNMVGDHVVEAHKMPETDADTLLLLTTIAKRLREAYRAVVKYDEVKMGPIFAFIENVHAFPGQGVSSTFKFGKHFGSLLMALTAAQIPYDLVSPRKWQAAMGCLTKGQKIVTKRKAQELFPGTSITHATADAILIAEWGDRQRRAGQW